MDNQPTEIINQDIDPMKMTIADFEFKIKYKLFCDLTNTSFLTNPFISVNDTNTLEMCCPITLLTELYNHTYPDHTRKFTNHIINKLSNQAVAILVINYMNFVVKYNSAIKYILSHINSLSFIAKQKQLSTIRNMDNFDKYCEYIGIELPK